MDLSILVAKMMALIYLATGLSVLFGQVNPKKALKGFSESPALTYVSGFLMVVLGALLVQYHNFWVSEWIVLVTIIAWALLIKGVLFLLLPKFFLALSEKFTSEKKWQGIVVLVVGLIFGYFGFLA
jgi:hypothetical protein